MSDDTPEASSSPDPARISSPGDFGRELTNARLRAGLAVRDLAAKAGIPTGTLSGYLTGVHLPQATFLDPFRRVLAACGESDPERVRQWEQAVLRVRRTPGRRPASSPAPYPGLRSFGPEDAPLFRGRDELTAQIVRRVEEGAGGQGWQSGQSGQSGRGGRGGRGGLGGRLLVVVGASGAGKSSLLGAGVVPALSERGLETALVVPGQALAQLEAWSADPDEAEGPARVLVVDQMEEALVRGAADSAGQALIEAFGRVGPRTVVVLGLRADFYLNALRHPVLAAALQEDQVIVRPMNAGELRRAILEPARQLGLEVEPSLVTLILRDLTPRTRDEPGDAAHEATSLPFLSHALRATWQQSRGRRMTVEDYLAVGGVEGSIAQTADEVLARLTDPQQDAARRLLLRLVRSVENFPDTRRRVPLAEVLDEQMGAAADDTRHVIYEFTAARLLTIDNDRAEITHEALLGAWPRLRGWIDAYRDWLRLHRRITEAADAWHETGRHPDGLYRGGLLELVAEWVEDRGYRNELNKREGEFYDESVRARATSAVRERRRIRRRYQVIAFFSVLAFIAAGLAAVARQAEHKNATDQAQAGSRSVANASDRLRSIDVSLSMQLALAAYRIWPTPEARAALIDSTDVTAGTRVMVPGDPVTAMTVGGPGGDLLAGALSSGNVRLWTLNSPTRITGSPTSLRGPGGTIQAIAFSPDGGLLAAGGTSGTVDVWNTSDLNTRRQPWLLGIPDDASGAITVTSVAFSPNGALLAVGASNGDIYLWDVDGPAQPQPLPKISTLPVGSTSVAFSRDGQILAGGSVDTVRLWNIAAPAAPIPLATVGAGSSLVFSVAISPNRRTLAVGASEAHSVLLWNIANPRAPQPLPALTGPTSWVNTAVFNAAGTEIAAGSSDGMLWIYDLATGQVVEELPQPRPVDEVVFRADGSLVTLADDGTVRSWQPPGPVIAGMKDTIFALGFNRAGTEMVVGPGAEDDTESLWNVTSIQDPRRIALISDPQSTAKFSGSGAITPDGRLVAVGDNDGTVQLWNVANPADPLPATRKPFLATSGALVESVGFDTSGKLLAVSNDDGTVPLYDVSDPTHPTLLATIPTQTRGTYTYESVFSPNDKLLAVESSDGHAYLWDVSNPRSPHRLAVLGGFTAAAYSAAFMDNGAYVAVGSADSTVRVWNVQRPGDPRLVSGPLSGPIGYIYSMAYDSQDKILAEGGSTDGTISLWNMADPAQPVLLANLTGPSGGVLSLSFSPDGSTLVAGGHAHVVRLWKVDTDTAASWICSVAGQGITRQEWAQYVPNAAYDPPCGS